jgi:hypothetical protein
MMFTAAAVVMAIAVALWARRPPGAKRTMPSTLKRSDWPCCRPVSKRD